MEQTANTETQAPRTVTGSRMAFRKIDKPQPTEKVNKSTGRISWGADNLYPQFLWYCYYNSPIHQGIVNSKVNYLVGGEWSVKSPDKRFEQWLKNGDAPQTIEELATELCLDNEVSNSYYVKCVYNKGLKRWQFEQVPFEKVRPVEDGMYFEYSDDWSQSRQGAKTGYDKIKNFDSRKGFETCIFEFKVKPRQQRVKGKVQGEYFPQPVYSAAMDSILADIQINFFRLAEVTNGYKGGSIVVLNNGAPETDAMRRKVLEDLGLEMSDPEKQGGTGVIWNEQGVDKPEVLQVNGNDLDKRYESTETGLATKMMIGHSVTNPKLFGVMTTAALSETDDEASYNRFQKTYGATRRKMIVEPLLWLTQTLNGDNFEAQLDAPELDAEKQLDSSSQTAEAINSMSPLLSTKLLESMTLNEIRALGKLGPIAGGDALPQQSAFSATLEAVKQVGFGKNPVLIAFNSCGSPKDRAKVFAHRADFSLKSDDGESFKTEFIKSLFASLSEIELNVLKALAEGKEANAIKDELELDNKDYKKAVSALETGGYLDGGTVTPKGEALTVEIGSVKVVYTYEERPNAPALSPGGQSREFCKELLNLNRVYTREEIDQISKAVKRDVWNYRGGWYHDPTTDKNQPSCRHYWLQNLIIEN